MRKETNPRTCRLLSVVVYISFVWLCIPLKASNYVTVATIGGQVPTLDKTQVIQKQVDQVKKFWQEKLAKVFPDKPDLIVLPELCDFSQGMTGEEKEKYLRVRKNQIQAFFASEAKANHCYIAFGMLREIEDGSWRNSCIIVDREGNVAGIYNKNFPTIEEMKVGVKAGTRSSIIKCDFGNVGCAICFDLNFDELRQVYEKLKPNIILFPSMYHGGMMQSYWAYSCKSFFIGSMAFRDIPSEIINPLGEVVVSSTNYFDYAVAKINLDNRLVHLDCNWEKLTRLKEKYGNKVIIKDPGKLGVVLLTSEDEKVTVDQMIKEFGIELLDDYFDRSRKCRLDPGNME